MIDIHLQTCKLNTCKLKTFSSSTKPTITSSTCKLVNSSTKKEYPMNKLHGFVGAITSATAFGLIPLFSLPVLATGMSSAAVLVYRFAFAGLIMLVILMCQRQSLHLRFGESLRLMLLSVVYTGRRCSLSRAIAICPAASPPSSCFHIPCGRHS